MIIAIGADHGALELKEFIKKSLKNVEFKDVGAYELNPEDDYTDFSFAVAQSVSNGESDFGIMLCRTGVGAVIAMNKVKGIRAGVCETKESVLLARQKNNINCLSLGADIVSKKLAIKICELFVNTKFDGGRHLRRVNKISEYEKGNCYEIKR